MATIVSISAREILDSEANPTVETTVVLKDGAVGVSSFPSLSKTNPYQAVEIRDTEDNRYHGKGVHHAISNVNTVIAQQLVGLNSVEQQKIDNILIKSDGTPNKARLGVNAIMSVSQAIATASAMSERLPLALYLQRFFSQSQSGKVIPTPIFSIIEEGEFGTGSVEFQEFLVIPASTKSYSDSLEIGVEVYRATNEFLHSRNLSTLASNEGGFSPYLATNRDALNLVKLAIDQSGFKFSLDVFLGIDCHANFFYKDKSYHLKDKSGRYSQDELVEYYKALFTDYSLQYIEDPFADDDWEGWKKVYSALGNKTIISGDDLTATNPVRIQAALDNNTINCVVIKPQQIGTITEAIAAVEIARFKHLNTVVADRESITLDSFVADFAVAASADYVKFGAPTKERIAEYNRLTAVQDVIKTVS